MKHHYALEKESISYKMQSPKEGPRYTHTSYKVPEGLALPRARNDLMKEFIKLLIHLFQHIPTIDAPSATDDILYLARVELEACTIGISYLYHSNLVPIVLQYRVSSDGLRLSRRFFTPYFISSIPNHNRKRLVSSLLSAYKQVLITRGVYFKIIAAHKPR